MASTAAPVSSERTPLIQRPPSRDVEARFPNEAEREASRKRKRISWTIVAVVALVTTCATILFLGFVTPAASEEYAKQAVVVNVSGVQAAPSQKGVGVSARVKVQVDAQRVDSRFSRRLGRMATWVVRYVEISPTTVQIRAPRFGKDTIALVHLPSFVVDVRNGHETELDIVGEVEPDSLDTIHAIVNKYLDGTLGDIELVGDAEFDVSTGWLKYGRQSVSESILLKTLPSVPSLNVTGLNLSEVDLDGHKAVGVDVTATTINPYPISLDTPPLVFGIYLPSCGEAPTTQSDLSHTDSITRVSTATLGSIAVRPGADIAAHVNAVIDALPDDLLTVCPGTEYSPLDNFLAGYMHGDETTLYVRGAGPKDSPGVPAWIAEFLSTITLPIPFPGHSFGNIIKEFGLSDVDFELPNPGAPEGSPDASPKLTAQANALISLPKEMNFPIDVKGARTNANIYYRKEKFGELHIREWVPARSTRTKDGDLQVEADIDRQPITITDGNVFTRIVTKLLFGDGPINLDIIAAVDVRMQTSMGEIVVRDISANGTITVDGF
ncbi:hypothetical protein BJ508DRAFT_234178 [Ascobolus immersus RN42]|uniref:Tag1 C-terminal domain-containing protein n=1 Tax=Ascobolus immersus RN42 TaxID=1160509 RepID=A0A3N4IL62_ASCIM|nr:hypothetical protein BJ508DRAFT_234178 [Ascobolus immersus RN42]